MKSMSRETRHGANRDLRLNNEKNHEKYPATIKTNIKVTIPSQIASQNI